MLGIAAVGTGICFIGYCIYFDRKRRSDPDFKIKLRAKRRKAKEANVTRTTSVPDFKDSEAMQRFFLQEIQLGEELLASGDIDGGVEHLGNAVAVCGTPQQLLTVLQQTLPPQVFQNLLQRLPGITQKITTSVTTPSMQEDDIE